jgi:transcriptional regulator with GAF, ATPase, and Fis domain
MLCAKSVDFTVRPFHFQENFKFIPFPVSGVFFTIDENERDHILAVLKKCNGRIWGYGGAAELLGVPPTTLNSKMKKLGIKRGAFT